MKKIYSIFTLITVLILTPGTIAKAQETYTTPTEDLQCASEVIDNIVFDYSSIAEGSEYTRICKNAKGEWLGVIFVEYHNMFSTRADAPYNNLIGLKFPTTFTHYLEFSFTRETQYLRAITIEYYVGGHCPYITCRFGGYIDEITKTETYTWDEAAIPLGEARTLEEAFGDGSITESMDPTYDYVIQLGITTLDKEETKVTTKILKFTYLLTDAEVDALNLDIQKQYETELRQIKENSILTDEEELTLIAALDEEYIDYHVDKGEEQTSPCVGEDCFTDNGGDEDPPPEDNLLSQILAALDEVVKVILIGVASLISGGIAVYIAYIIISKATISVGTNVAKGTGTVVTRVGGYWGDKISNGTSSFIISVHNGVKLIFKGFTPLFYMILTIGTIVFIFYL